MEPLDAYIAVVHQSERDSFVARYPGPFLVITVPDNAPSDPWRHFQTLQIHSTIVSHPPPPEASKYRLYRLSRGLPTGHEAIQVGRAANLNLPLEHASVSKLHAEINWSAAADGANGLTIQDLGSRNGTWVNGRELRPQEEVALVPGDALRLGGVEVLFVNGLGLFTFLSDMLNLSTSQRANDDGQA